jgi:hypothetical protein
VAVYASGLVLHRTGRPVNGSTNRVLPRPAPIIGKQPTVVRFGWVWSNGDGESGKNVGISVQSRAVDIPDVFELADTTGRILVDSILGCGGQPSASIDTVAAIAVDADHIGGVEPNPEAFRVEPFQVRVVFQLLGNTFAKERFALGECEHGRTFQGRERG